MASKPMGHPDDKRPSVDSSVGSGVSKGATANTVDEAADVDSTGCSGTGALPLPTGLPSMATLEALTTDLDLE